MDKKILIAKALGKLNEKGFLDAKPEKIEKSEKKKISIAFTKEGLDGNGRFKKIDHAITKINEILKDNGFELENIPSIGSLQGNQGQKQLHIARKDKESSIPIKNSIIAFSWYNTLSLGQIEKGEANYEILAYLS